MADYKELIRKAIQALPENNGAARRAVYEKARAALVGQLRGLNPPLAARDITQHRLQLEDCIRQVEQEASEAVIAGLKQNEDMVPPRQAALPPPRPAAPTPRPVPQIARPAALNGTRPPVSAEPGRNVPRPAPTPAPPPRPAVALAAPRPAISKPAAPAPVPRIAAVQPRSAPAIAAPAARAPVPVRPVPRQQPSAMSRAAVQPEPEPDLESETIEDIIAAAEDDLVEPIEMDEALPPEEVEPAVEPPMFKMDPRSPRKPATGAAPRTENVAPRAESRPLPAIVARAEAAKAGRPVPKAPEPARRTNGSDTHRNGVAATPRPQITPRAPAEPIQLPRPTNNNAAMSSVREVDIENATEGDPQVAIERAIATLEREARNDGDEVNAEADVPATRPSRPGRRRNALDREQNEQAADVDTGFARAPVERERGGGSAITIFLLVFLVLLIIAGGAGIWAWREGFIDFDAMFGKTPVVSQTTSSDDNSPTANQPDKSSVVANTAPSVSPPVAAQTNTEPASNTPAQSSAALSTAPAPTPLAAAPTPSPAEPSAQTTGAPKSEERLTQSADNATAPPATDNTQPSTPGATASNGSQSLLLEASQDGTTGAVPFSGTVEWSKGTDEMGQPTLVGKASIPARNLGVSVLIRKNSDPTLPASHLMEINFTVNDSFIGGSIAGLPGVLLKNEELVQGTPLVGASARVVGNSFLFALSSSAADEATNKDLLTSRKWIDLAIIYATGKKAIITLEKDDKAEQMFNEVFDAWTKEAAAKPGAAPTPAPATSTPAK